VGTRKVALARLSAVARLVAEPCRPEASSFKATLGLLQRPVKSVDDTRGRSNSSLISYSRSTRRGTRDEVDKRYSRSGAPVFCELRAPAAKLSMAGNGLVMNSIFLEETEPDWKIGSGSQCALVQHAGAHAHSDEVCETTPYSARSEPRSTRQRLFPGSAASGRCMPPVSGCWPDRQQVSYRRTNPGSRRAASALNSCMYKNFWFGQIWQGCRLLNN
jgi:hypothetical protein